jgi:hypothetical protein
MEPNQTPVQPAPQPIQATSEPTKKSLPKWPLIIVGMILLATLLTGSFVLYKNMTVKPKPVVKTTQVSATSASPTLSIASPTPTPTPIVYPSHSTVTKTPNGNLVTNTKYGFNFTVPSDWDAIDLGVNILVAPQETTDVLRKALSHGGIDGPNILGINVTTIPFDQITQSDAISFQKEAITFAGIPAIKYTRTYLQNLPGATKGQGDVVIEFIKDGIYYEIIYPRNNYQTTNEQILSTFKFTQ